MRTYAEIIKDVRYSTYASLLPSQPKNVHPETYLQIAKDIYIAELQAHTTMMINEIRTIDPDQFIKKEVCKHDNV